MVQWVVEVCGCVSEPESGPVGRRSCSAAGGEGLCSRR